MKMKMKLKLNKKQAEIFGLTEGQMVETLEEDNKEKIKEARQEDNVILAMQVRDLNIKDEEYSVFVLIKDGNDFMGNMFIIRVTNKMGYAVIDSLIKENKDINQFLKRHKFDIIKITYNPMNITV